MHAMNEAFFGRISIKNARKNTVNTPMAGATGSD